MADENTNTPPNITPEQLDALIDARIAERSKAAPIAAPTASAAPGPRTYTLQEYEAMKAAENAEAMVTMPVSELERIRSGAPAHVQREPVYREPPGAPRGDPDRGRGEDLMSWSRDDVQRARENGTFLEEVQKFRNSLPGGNPNGLFQRRNKALGR